jgi:hypothetical protein
MVIAGTAVVCCAWQQATFPCWWRAHKYSHLLRLFSSIRPRRRLLPPVAWPLLCSARVFSVALLCSVPFLDIYGVPGEQRREGVRRRRGRRHGRRADGPPPRHAPHPPAAAAAAPQHRLRRAARHPPRRRPRRALPRHERAARVRRLPGHLPCFLCFHSRPPRAIVPPSRARQIRLLSFA